jgi:hypothetical protein
MAEWVEPAMTINGTRLTTAQAMTVRVAISTFAMDLQASGLGDDETGREIAQGYLAAISQLYRLMRAE